MDSHQMSWNEKVAENIINQLEKRNIEGSYAPTVVEAKEQVLQMIAEGSILYRCGSMSTVEMGLWEDIAKVPGVEIIDPYESGISREESFARRMRGFGADIMIASSNAITLDGRLVNLDAGGPRVASMAFGPKKVILVVGMNKVTPDLESAISRVRNYSAPVNAIRFGSDTPCVKTGLCSDCSSPRRICNVWSIIEGHMWKNRIHVKLVGESLGY